MMRLLCTMSAGDDVEQAQRRRKFETRAPTHLRGDDGENSEHIVAVQSFQIRHEGSAYIRPPKSVETSIAPRIFLAAFSSIFLAVVHDVVDAEDTLARPERQWQRRGWHTRGTPRQPLAQSSQCPWTEPIRVERDVKIQQ